MNEEPRRTSVSTESREDPPSGDRVAADLRGFRPLEILASLVIVLSGNVTAGRVVVPLGAVL